jgi:hypothetical protein
MSLVSLLRSARSLFATDRTKKPRRCARAAKRGLPTRLSVERLDERVVLSTFSVLNLADSGTGSLRAAILDANVNPGADLIRFAPAARDGTITLTSGELSITDDLILDGPGVNRLTISGNDASRVFSVSGSATDVEIRDLTIANGRATGTTVEGPFGPVTLGGGLLNTGARVVVSHVTMDNNQAVGPIAQGGAIATFAGATLVVTHSTFTDNRAAGILHGSGGAIGSDGGSVLVLDDSTFTGNQATAMLGAGPVLIHGNAVGGAVKITGGSQATVSHTTFAGNLARGGNGVDGGPGQKGGDGGFGVAGALENAYYSLVGPSASSTMTVAYCTFLSNRALGGTGGTGGTGGAGGAGRGGVGGVISNAGSNLTISHSTFLGNQSLGGRGGNGGEGGNGGAGGPGQGGVINNSNPTGGLLVRATLHVSDSVFQGNEAIGGAGGNGGSGGNGGAGGVGGGGGLSNRFADWDVRDSWFAFNRATGGAGGDRGSGGLLGGTGGAGRGGGINNGDGAIGTLSDSTVFLNTAIGGVGGVAGNGGNGQGGGVFNGGPSPLGTPSLTLHRSLVAFNRADGGAAGEGGSAGSGVGGGLYLSLGGVASADPWTFIFANDASTSDDDVFGDLCFI